MRINALVSDLIGPTKDGGGGTVNEPMVVHQRNW